MSRYFKIFMQINLPLFKLNIRKTVKTIKFQFYYRCIIFHDQHTVWDERILTQDSFGFAIVSYIQYEFIFPLYT